MAPRASAQDAAVPATATAAASAAATTQVAWQQAIDHPPDAMQKDQWPEAAATTAAAAVVAVGLHRHRIAARPVRHGHIVSPDIGRRWTNDRLRLRRRRSA